MNEVDQTLLARLPRDRYNKLVKKINVVGKEKSKETGIVSYVVKKFTQSFTN